MEAARGGLLPLASAPLLQATGKNAAVVAVLMTTAVVFLCCPCGGSTGRVEEEEEHHHRYQLWTTSSFVTVGDGAGNATITAARRTELLGDDGTGGVGSSAAGDIGREVEWVMMEPESSRRRILSPSSGFVAPKTIDSGHAVCQHEPYGIACGTHGVNVKGRACLAYDRCRGKTEVQAMAAYIVTEFP